MNLEAIDLYLEEHLKGNSPSSTFADADIAEYLKRVKQEDETKFFAYINSLSPALAARTIIEMPIAFQIDFIEQCAPGDLGNIIESLESDDATDFFQAIEKLKGKKSADAIFSNLSDKKQQEIESLIFYDVREVGSLMQTELLGATPDESVQTVLNRLQTLKSHKALQTHYLYITDKKNLLLKIIPMDDLILEEKATTLEVAMERFGASHACVSHDDIDTALRMIEKYNITELAIVDRVGHLIGRITHDDIVDIIHRRATSQMYGLAHVHQSEEPLESFSTTGKARALWLMINLLNAIAASLVIGFFEKTLDAVVILAVLMPIVANMAGTASVQTMTVMVRQMALGQITYNAAKPTIVKELTIAAINGFLFGILTFFVSQIWFGNFLVSIAMGLSMVVSFIAAGILGTLVPIWLRKMHFDPAVASSVIVITAVDIIGFFSFLGFADLILF